MSLDGPLQARFADIAEEIHQSYRGGNDGEWVDSIGCDPVAVI